MIKKLIAFILILLGALMVGISIMGLVKAFDVFNTIGPDVENFGYVLGSIMIPVLLTVTGRWIYRKGLTLWRNG